MKRKPQREARMIGLGLDGKDGHVRITQGPNFAVLMGSEETHERLQETCIKVNEKLERKGRTLGDLSGEEFVDLVTEAGGHHGS